MSSGLGDCLVRDGLLPEATVRAALGRQIVYGGTLDTVLLEMGVIDEPTLWGALAAATGLPVPDRALVENADASLVALFGAAGMQPGLAVPLQRRDDRLQVMCADPVNQGALREAGRALGLAVDLFVAPEVRVRAAAQTVLGAPVPARFLRLLARLVGSQPVRRWVSAQAAAPPPLPRAPINVVVAATPPPVPPPRAAATRAGTRTTTARSSTAGPRPTRARRHAAPVAEAPAQTTSGDGTDTVEGLAPLQQVLECSPAFAEPEPRQEQERESSLSASEFGEPPAPVSQVAGPAPNDGPPPQTAADGQPDERLLRTAEDPAAEDRVPALWALRVHLQHPRVRALADGLRDDLTNAPGERATSAAAALGELRDPAAVPALIGRLDDKDGPLTRAAHQALVAITKQDLGHGARRWRGWWDKHGDEERMDWLFAGLSHKSPEVRATSSEELRLLTGQYFGYHHDLPRRARQEARARWETWWLGSRGGVRS